MYDIITIPSSLYRVICIIYILWDCVLSLNMVRTIQMIERINRRKWAVKRYGYGMEKSQTLVKCIKHCMDTVCRMPYTRVCTQCHKCLLVDTMVAP